MKQEMKGKANGGHVDKDAENAEKIARAHASG
jgi:hypothetical protein